jgi:hypothetical protein
MQDGKVSRAAFNPLSRNLLSPIVAILLFIAVMVYWRIGRTAQQNLLSADTVTISQSVLEEKYGVQVNLLAVTAAGGFVDLRLRILDGEKARTLLEDPNSFPSLVVDNSIQLSISQEAKERGIDFENSHTLFVMFPNSGNFIRKGTPVTILFGDIALEPVEAQ